MHSFPVPPVRDLLLLGGGHAHVQVLKMLGMDGPTDLRVTLINDGPTAYYSGMLPGCVAGLYSPEEIRIELRPLCRWAGARFVEARATGIDHLGKRIEFADRAPMSYDVLSINVGSITLCSNLPDVCKFALSTRPLSRFLEKLDQIENAFSARPVAPRVVVVGGGAAGVELAFGLRARMSKKFGSTRVTIVDAHPRLMLARGSWTSRLVHQTMAEFGIELVLEAKAIRAGPDTLSLEDGRILPFDLLIWAAGGAAPELLKNTGLSKDAEGFVKVRASLQSETAESIFAAGDCVSLEGSPGLPKAGVYAVREGPYLRRNLEAYLRGDALEAYKPQHDFLALLMTGDGGAIASRNGLAVRGRLVWKWKDYIDRKFVYNFDPRHIRAPAMHAGTPLDAPTKAQPELMRCAGCGGKVGATSLAKALTKVPRAPHPSVRVGLDAPDDASVVEVPSGKVLVQTVDHFRAFLDDPYLVGRIAAVHAASDLYAMGAQPDSLLVSATLPYASEECIERDLEALLAGIVREAAAMGAALIGGHTAEGPELSVGLTVNGFARPEDLRSKAGLRVGDLLILTKPLGTGAILAADVRQHPVGHAVSSAVASMLRSNGLAAEILIKLGARAMTDITGFGLGVHLAEMLEAAGVSAALDVAALPILPGALECIGQGVISSIHTPNRRHLHHRFKVAGDNRPGGEILYDPQTSGGLLAGVPPESAEIALRELCATGFKEAAVIGEVILGKHTLTVR